MCLNKKIILSVLTFFSIALCSACRQSSTRDKLIFIDSANEVQNSIIRLNLLMEKIITSDGINYFFDDSSYFYLNSKKLIVLKDTKNYSSLYSDSVFTNLDSAEIDVFIHDALFLKKNFINSVHKDQYFNVYFYSYKMTDENTFDDVRDIMIMDSSQKLPASDVEYHQLLDKKDRLLLVRPIDKRNNLSK